jgi:quercetin dioxygenase-like cupin family protein
MEEINMIKAGFSTIDPRTQVRTILIEGEAEMEGKGWVLEVHCPPKAGRHILEHIHSSWTETFEIVSGTARYKLNGQKQTAQAGDSIVMPPNQPQVHPWNVGETEMVYRQINAFEKPNREAVQDVLGTFATLNGLGREGKLGKRGLPKNPLQFSATLRTLVKHEGYDASTPILAQKIIAATLGRLAEALGYRSSYPRHLHDPNEETL